MNDECDEMKLKMPSSCRTYVEDIEDINKQTSTDPTRFIEDGVLFKLYTTPF